ncbi:hypothetical protein EJB05_11687, partial [Eragrostis curvula]
MASSRAKRARPELANPQAALSGSSPLHSDWRDWASLTAGPAALIAERALSNDVADYVRFRTVCTAWRALCPDPRAQEISDRRFHPRQWIMLPSNFNVDRRRCFVNVSTGEKIHVGILDLRRYYFRGPTAEGFLVLCQKSTHVVQLLNPITGQVTDLPCANTLLDPDPDPVTTDQLRSLDFCSAGVTNDNTVALLYDFHKFAIAKPGQEAWRRLDVGQHRIMAALPFAGRMYCVTEKKILVVDEDNTSASPRLVVVADFKLEREFSLLYDRMHPVFDERGGLVLVHRTHRFIENRFTEKFTAYRARLDAGIMEPIRGLGGQALFICSSHPAGPSQSVPAKFSSSIKPDTIYLCRKYSDVNQVDIVAFDPSAGTFVETEFDKKDIVKFLIAYVVTS